MNKEIRQRLRELEALGATWRMTSDGHVLVLDRRGNVAGKMRTSGKQVADGKGSVGRSVQRGIARKVLAS